MTNINDKIKYWIELSEYDLETAEAMLKTKRFLYVGFMCHQAVEKMLKGYYVSVKREEPPYTHNLAKLSSETGLYKLMSDERKDFLDYIQPMNIKARYPGYRKEILKDLNSDVCKDIIDNTKKSIKWIKSKL